MMKFQFSSVTSRKFIGLLTPALLNLTSSFPKRIRHARSAHAPRHAMSVDIGRGVRHLASGGLGGGKVRCRCSLSDLVAVDIRKTDIGALAQERLADGSANAACAAPVTMQERPDNRPMRTSPNMANSTGKG
jgi:hypothetical protein